MLSAYQETSKSLETRTPRAAASLYVRNGRFRPWVTDR